jgi:hypothetical protein
MSAALVARRSPAAGKKRIGKVAHPVALLDYAPEACAARPKDKYPFSCSDILPAR